MMNAEELRSKIAAELGPDVEVGVQPSYDIKIRASRADRKPYTQTFYDSMLADAANAEIHIANSCGEARVRLGVD